MPSPSARATAPTRHPMLVHTPIGAVFAATAMDALSVALGGSHSLARELFRAATFILMLGTGSMALTISTGFVDRAKHSSAGTGQRRSVNRHAAIMMAAPVLCVADITLRRGHYAGAASTPPINLVLSLAALAVVMVGGHLGGKLVYRHRVGVSAVVEPSTEPTEPTEPQLEPTGLPA